MKSGFVALIGRPNAGKSTLVNQMVGQKVAIVSDKPQTTRHRITGVLNGPDHQIVLLDMPGFQKPRDELTSRMQAVVNTTLEEVDVVLFLIPGDQRIGKGDSFIAQQLRHVNTPVVAAVNKIDLLSEEQRLSQLAGLRALGDFHSFFPISALDGAGLDGLRSELESLMPEGPQYFPPDVVTDEPEEVLVAELVREKVLHVTEEEVPHSVAVKVLEMEPRQGKDLVDIQAAIYVERESQKPIIIGEGGLRLKRIGSEARVDIERLLGSQVYLELVVRVRKHWRTDPKTLGQLGM